MSTSIGQSNTRSAPSATLPVNRDVDARFAAVRGMGSARIVARSLSSNVRAVSASIPIKPNSEWIASRRGLPKKISDTPAPTGPWCYGTSPRYINPSQPPTAQIVFGTLTVDTPIPATGGKAVATPCVPMPTTPLSTAPIVPKQQVLGVGAPPSGGFMLNTTYVSSITGKPISELEALNLGPLLITPTARVKR